MNFAECLSLIAFLGITYGIYQIANGRLQGKVNKDACHTAMKALDVRFDDLKEHIDNRLNDLKEFIRNGK